MLSTIIVIAIGVLYGFLGGYELTKIMLANKEGTPIKRSKSAAYALCVLLVFVSAVLFGLIAAAPVFPGDEIESTHEVATEYRPPMPLSKRDKLIENTFLVILVPALIGVRSAFREQAKT